MAVASEVLEAVGVTSLVKLAEADNVEETIVLAIEESVLDAEPVTPEVAPEVASEVVDEAITARPASGPLGLVF